MLSGITETLLDPRWVYRHQECLYGGLPERWRPTEFLPRRNFKGVLNIIYTSYFLYYLQHLVLWEGGQPAFTVEYPLSEKSNELKFLWSLFYIWTTISWRYNSGLISYCYINLQSDEISYKILNTWADGLITHLVEHC